MPRSRKRTLGVVPRALLTGALAGAVPACASKTAHRDGGPADAMPQAERPLFAVDAPAFSPPERPDGGMDARPDAGEDRPLIGVADLGFRPDAGPDAARDAGADASDAGRDVRLFAVDAAAFKG